MTRINPYAALALVWLCCTGMGQQPSSAPAAETAYTTDTHDDASAEPDAQGHDDQPSSASPRASSHPASAPTSRGTWTESR